MTELLTVTKNGRVAVVTITNPPLNVLSNSVFEALDKTFKELGEDGETNVVILTGDGNKAFVAGADIKEFPQWIGQPGLKEDFMKSHDIMARIANFPKPVIAVLNGMTLGGGTELALCADIRIAEEHVYMGLPEITLGLFPGGGGTQRLPRLIGVAKTKELMFTGEAITANEAERIGLVNKVVEKEQGLVVATTMAEKMSLFSTQSTSRIKKAVNDGAALTLGQGIELEAELFAEMFLTEDIKEGVQAFIEKRKPEFRNE